METKSQFLKSELINWYSKNKRNFSWRNSNDPWKILLIETLAQQTQLERADSYFKKFIKKYPSPDKMAKDSFSEVLKMWSGLGYNNRAKRLHDASKILTNQQFDEIYPNFEILPGVGKYTKSALLSFSYGDKVITEDTHVNKIISRFFGVDNVNAFILENSEKLLDGVNSRDLNQSFMDFGSTVCTKQNPKCAICPLSIKCKKYFTNKPSVQAKFKGSNREIRGKILKLLSSKDKLTKNQLAKELEVNKEKIEIALSGLVKDGILKKSSNNNFEINS